MQKSKYERDKEEWQKLANPSDGQGVKNGNAF